MAEFYQGIIAAVAILGGFCTFFYWVFNMMEKRIETKLESSVNAVETKVIAVERKIDAVERSLSKDIEVIGQKLDFFIQEQAEQRKRSELDQAEQRKRTDQLYESLMDLMRHQNIPRTNP